jgi:hypothetical protein
MRLPGVRPHVYSFPLGQELIAFLALTIATNWHFGDGLSLLATDAIANMRNFREGDVVLRAADMFAALAGHLDRARRKVERQQVGGWVCGRACVLDRRLQKSVRPPAAPSCGTPPPLSHKSTQSRGRTGVPSLPSPPAPGCAPSGVMALAHVARFPCVRVCVPGCAHRVAQVSTGGDGVTTPASPRSHTGPASWLDTVAEAEQWDVVLHPVELEAASRAAGA